MKSIEELIGTFNAAAKLKGHARMSELIRIRLDIRDIELAEYNQPGAVPYATLIRIAPLLEKVDAAINRCQAGLRRGQKSSHV